MMNNSEQAVDQPRNKSPLQAVSFTARNDNQQPGPSGTSNSKQAEPRENCEGPDIPVIYAELKKREELKRRQELMYGKNSETENIAYDGNLKDKVRKFNFVAGESSTVEPTAVHPTTLTSAKVEPTTVESTMVKPTTVESTPETPVGAPLTKNPSTETQNDDSLSQTDSISRTTLMRAQSSTDKAGLIKKTWRERRAERIAAKQAENSQGIPVSSPIESKVAKVVPSVKYILPPTPTPSLDDTPVSSVANEGENPEPAVSEIPSKMASLSNRNSQMNISPTASIFETAVSIQAEDSSPADNNVDDVTDRENDNLNAAGPSEQENSATFPAPISSPEPSMYVRPLAKVCGCRNPKCKHRRL